MKYIIFKQLNEEFPVIFPSTIKHSEVAYNLSTVLFPYPVPVSAGFLKPEPFGIGVACYGDSMTLNLPSRSQDSTIVNEFLGLL